MNKTRFQDLFPDEEACLRRLAGHRETRLPRDRSRCPLLRGSISPLVPDKTPDHIVLGRQRGRPECASRQCWSGCKLKRGSLFQGHGRELRPWFRTIWLMTVPEEGIGAVELKAKLGFDGAITATRWQHRVRQAMGTACLAAADYLGRDAEPEVMELKFAAAPPWLAAMRVVLVRPPPGCQGGPFLLRVPGTDTNTVHPAVIRELRSRWNSLTEQQRALRLPLRRDLPQSLDTLAQKLAAWLTDRAGLTQLPGDVQEYLDEFCFLYYDDEHAGADRVRDLFEPLLKTACLPPSENGPGASALPTPS